MGRTTEHGVAGPDLVLENLAWVRALARRLVEDVAEADDLVQEAWLAARGREPASTGERGVRPWLGGVVRNIARRRRRAGRARTERESRSARADRTPRRAEPDALVERSEQLTEVARAVLELPEPYRRAMLLRWFEGRDAAEIASVEGIDPATVRTRMHRGRALLRETLDERDGGRSTGWALALVPAAALAGAEATARAGGAARAGAFASAVLVLGGSSWWIASRPVEPATRAERRDMAEMEPSRTAAMPPSSSPAMTALPEPATRTSRTTSGGQGPAAAALDGPEAGSGPTDTSAALGGIVVLGDGTPLSTVPLAVVRPGTQETIALTSTDSDGRFHIEAVTGGPMLAQVADHWTHEAETDRPLLPGTNGHVLVVDAMLYRVRAHDPAMGTVPMKTFVAEFLKDGRLAGTSSWSRKRDTVESTELLVPTDHGLVLSATGEDGRNFARVLQASPPSRAVDVLLLENAPELGCVAVSVTNPEIPDGALLRCDSISLDRYRRMRIVEPGVAERGRAEVAIDSLLPGQYDLRFSLDGSPFVGLVSPEFEVDVAAGVEETVALATYEGGNVKLSVVTAYGGGDALEPVLSLRVEGEREWRTPMFLEGEPAAAATSGGEGPCVMTAARPLAPGRYELRIEAPGFETRIEPLRILVGAFAEVEVILEAAPR